MCYLEDTPVCLLLHSVPAVHWQTVTKATAPRVGIMNRRKVNIFRFCLMVFTSIF